MKRDYEWCITSNPAHVPSLIKNVLDTLQVSFNEMTQEERGDIKLILSELIFNAVLHGNLSNENKYVHVALTVENKMISVRITDEGIGFNTDEINLQLLDEECLKMENGRGIALAHALSDGIKYSNEGRTVTVIKYIGMINPVLTGV